MKKLLIIPLILMMVGCALKKPNLTEREVIVVKYIDSVVWHDSTIYHDVYREYYNDYTGMLDTLYMETSYSEFTAFNDTILRVLRGTASNKDVKIPVQIKWKEQIVYRDSIQYKEVPYPVEVVKTKTKYPKTYWIFMGISILSLGFAALKLYLKFKLP